MPKQTLSNLYTMEIHSFSPGRPRQETKHQRRQRLRRQFLEKRRKEMRQRSHQSLPHHPSWLLLPRHMTKGFEFWILTLKGDTFLQKKATLLEDMKRNDEPIENAFTFDPLAMEQFRKDYKEKAKAVMDLLYQNQNIRWMFKRFFTQLRIRRFNPCNDVDPITMELIKQPIHVPLFSQRKVYLFEAKPFLKHLHNRLVHCDGHLSIPQEMKNPLTNEVFTTAQMMSLIAQAKAYGHSSWAIEAFLACRYTLSTFVLVYSKPLRLHALRTTMANVTTWDSIDTLYDFIKSQHQFHDEVFRQDIYKWAVHHAPHASRIESWRNLCLKWYEVEILIDDDDTKEKMLRVVEAKTMVLCTRPKELQDLRRTKAKSSVSSDGSSSL